MNLLGGSACNDCSHNRGIAGLGSSATPQVFCEPQARYVYPQKICSIKEGLAIRERVLTGACPNPCFVCRHRENCPFKEQHGGERQDLEEGAWSFLLPGPCLRFDLDLGNLEATMPLLRKLLERAPEAMRQAGS